jgi:hypothetical protein
MSEQSLRGPGTVVHIPNAGEGVECRIVPGWDAYAVGNDGIVWTSYEKRRLDVGRGFEMVPHSGWWRMSLCINRTGYQYVLLWKQGKKRHSPVHWIVATAFLGERPSGMQCRHLDGNPLNNRPSNLKWGTPRENQRDRFKHGTDNRGVANGRSKLSESNVREIRRRYASGRISQESLGKEFGVSQCMIGAIVLRKNWRHVQ